MSSNTTSESMARTLRWGVGLLLVVSLSIGAFLLLPFRSWLPGGTVGDVPLNQVVNGTAFNRLFPEPDDGDQLVFTQEKRGFSEARLKHGGQVKALLAISDVSTAPEARRKFETSQSRLQGWPLVEQGPQATALLVADRFQIKVIGQGDGLEAEQRQILIGRFNLRGLAALKSASAPRASLPSGPDSAGRQSLERRAAMEPAS